MCIVDCFYFETTLNKFYPKHNYIIDCVRIIVVVYTRELINSIKMMRYAFVFLLTIKSPGKTVAARPFYSQFWIFARRIQYNIALRHDLPLLLIANAKLRMMR